MSLVRINMTPLSVFLLMWKKKKKKILQTAESTGFSQSSLFNSYMTTAITLKKKKKICTHIRNFLYTKLVVQFTINTWSTYMW